MIKKKPEIHVDFLPVVLGVFSNAYGRSSFILKLIFLNFMQWYFCMIAHQLVLYLNVN